MYTLIISNLDPCGWLVGWLILSASKRSGGNIFDAHWVCAVCVCVCKQQHVEMIALFDEPHYLIEWFTIFLQRFLLVLSIISFSLYWSSFTLNWPNHWPCHHQIVCMRSNLLFMNQKVGNACGQTLWAVLRCAVVAFIVEIFFVSYSL